MLGFKNVNHITYKGNSEIIESILPLEKCSIKTSIGELTPIYKVDDHGRKKLSPVKLDKIGKLKSISLQNQVHIPTGIGNIKAELVTFYSNGSLCRAFPLNGKLSGYWSELNEYKLAETIQFNTSVGVLHIKPINIHFYESGELKSVTFWPREKTKISTIHGEWNIKSGISFHKNGEIASCEPESTIFIETPLGIVEAYDPDPSGINGDKNSLQFKKSGEISAFSTISSSFEVIDKDGKEKIFEPQISVSYCNDNEFIVQPLKVEFHNENIVFKNGFTTSEIVKADCNFTVKRFEPPVKLSSPMICQ